jgi:hypothetical protein
MGTLWGISMESLEYREGFEVMKTSGTRFKTMREQHYISPHCELIAVFNNKYMGSELISDPVPLVFNPSPFISSTNSSSKNHLRYPYDSV